MKEEKFEKWMPFIERWVPLCMGLFVTAGAAVVATYAIYIFQDEFIWDFIIAAAIVIVAYTTYYLLKLKRKKDYTPEFDERTMKNVFKFFAGVSFVFIFLFFIFLGGVTLLGYHTVSLLHLWIFALLYFFISGIGLFIVKRR
ncbi:hypothetical protein CIL05_10215 [Virgibacillus profundi]|uniref:Uncharacterized protein n=1 Tax=Virgibacillus profundi TaxID=2024555 RepID=A0A2A2IEQ3_9BACI|nr:hypothetical protein [Virgibacillus profundi]PAV29734.1 hypothetical protein CIL05_10215 [Virgibacillus profundi]PXY53905.1 hypothetical protein CIT14_10315 [Virgibacillus profundi]